MSKAMSTITRIKAHASEIYSDKVRKGLPLSNDERKVLQMAVAVTPKRTMYFKDEGNYYVTKLTASGNPIDPFGVYPFGSLTEVPFPTKTLCKQYAKQNGCIASFG